MPDASDIEAFRPAVAALPFFLTTDDVANLLRCEASGDTPETARENRRRQARYWLQTHQVPVIGRGRRVIVRREALLAALAEAEAPRD